MLQVSRPPSQPTQQSAKKVAKTISAPSNPVLITDLVPQELVTPAVETVTTNDVEVTGQAAVIGVEDRNASPEVVDFSPPKFQVN